MKRSILAVTGLTLALSGAAYAAEPTLSPEAKGGQ